MVQNSATRSHKNRQVYQYIWSKMILFQARTCIKNFNYYFLCLKFYCGHFKAIATLKNKGFGSFLVILAHAKKKFFTKLSDRICRRNFLAEKR
jgi:hypothetical protein